MKTKNNIQKTILKSLAVVFSLVLISLSVNAQNLWNSIIGNSSFNGIALAMVDNGLNTSPSTNHAEALAAYFEVDTEESLKAEDWMTDESYFISSFFQLADETEEPLECEEWMMNENNFALSIAIKETTDEPLNLENWMTDENYFSPTK